MIRKIFSLTLLISMSAYGWSQHSICGMSTSDQHEMTEMFSHAVEGGMKATMMIQGSPT